MSTPSPLSHNDAYLRLSTHLTQAIEKYKKGDTQTFTQILSILHTKNLSGIQILLSCMRQRAIELSKIDISTHLSQFKCWRDVKIVESFLQFLTDLVSADGCLIGSVFAILLIHLKQLHSCTQPTEKDKANNKDPEEPIPNEILELVHHSFARLISLVPRGYTILWNEILFAFPHHNSENELLIGFINSMMRVSMYCPLLRDRIIASIVEKAIHLDVEIKIEEIEEEEESEGIFIDDQDDLSTLTKKKNKMRLYADKLDSIMTILFEDIEFIRSQEDQQLLDDTHNLYLKIFDAAILLTHRCKVVQFLLFYVSHIKPEYTISFIGYLLSKFELSTNTIIIRTSALSYLASFLARAKYVKLATIKQTLSFLASWIIFYLETEAHNKEITENGNLTHRVFYVACESLFYILCFRHWKIFKDPSGYSFCQELKLGDIVMSPLNPLNECCTSVGREFVRMCDFRNLGKWTEILYRNKNYAKSAQDGFFPFDPYLLKNSSKFIGNLYCKWKGIAQEEEQTDEETENEEKDKGEIGDEKDEEEAESDSDVPKVMSYVEEIPYDLDYQFGSH